MPKTGYKAVNIGNVPYPKMPSGLSPVIQKWFKKIIKTKQAAFWEASDIELIVSYCHCLNDRDTADAILAEHGTVLADQNGKLYPNPAAALKIKSLQLVTLYQTKLRLCPSARMKPEAKENTRSGVKAVLDTPLSRLLA